MKKKVGFCCAFVQEHFDSDKHTLKLSEDKIFHWDRQRDVKTIPLSKMIYIVFFFHQPSGTPGNEPVIPLGGPDPQVENKWYSVQNARL